jgi:predicted ATPase
MSSLDKLTIKGFKSIKKLVDFKLTNLNVIIGGNGAGKSNLISFFHMLRELINGNLNNFVRDSGGAGDLLFNGRKITKEMEFETLFGDRGYRFKLIPTPSDTCALSGEERYYKYGRSGWWELPDSENGIPSLVKEAIGNTSDSKYSKRVYEVISSWQIYHFHDTSENAAMRHNEIVQDNKYLRTDASNIAPYLH